MGAFNPDDYAPVEERITLFYAAHPEGRILTNIAHIDPPLVVFRAEVYRDADDTRPWATGYAYEKEGEGHVNRTSYVENCETSAIGRALANAGYHGSRDGKKAPRPSREEMEKVERMGGSPAKTARDGFSLDDTAPGKKPNGRSWREMIEQDPGYVTWALGPKGFTTLSPEARRTLEAAMKKPETPLSEPEPDGLPF